MMDSDGPSEIPQVDFTSYNIHVGIDNRIIDLDSNTDIERSLNKIGTVKRSGYIININMIEDDIEEIRKVIHLLTYIRKGGSE
jgi:hypothetical protein